MATAIFILNVAAAIYFDLNISHVARSGFRSSFCEQLMLENINSKQCT